MPSLILSSPTSIKNVVNQSKSFTFNLVWVTLAGLALAGCTVPNSNSSSNPTPTLDPSLVSPTSITSSTLTEAAARSIATTENNECRAIGTIGATEIYNPNSQTWWFTLTPLEPKAGCKPACVVGTGNDDQPTVEVNWRCTGLKPAQP